MLDQLRERLWKRAIDMKMENKTVTDLESELKSALKRIDDLEKAAGIWWNYW